MRGRPEITQLAPPPLRIVGYFARVDNFRFSKPLEREKLATNSAGIEPVSRFPIIIYRSYTELVHGESFSFLSVPITGYLFARKGITFDDRPAHCRAGV